MIDGCMSTNRGRKDAPVVADGAGVTLRHAGAERAGLPAARRRDRARAGCRRPDRADPRARALDRRHHRAGAANSPPTTTAIVLVDNPEADIPIGLNRAIRAGRYPTIVRVDAHSELRARLHRAGARDARPRARGERRRRDARRRAHALPARRRARLQLPRSGSAAAPTTAARRRARRSRAYLGVMRRAVLDEVGLFDETHPPRRGLGAEPAHPPGRLPRLVRSRRSRSPTGRARAGPAWCASSRRRAGGAASSSAATGAATRCASSRRPRSSSTIALSIVVGVLQLDGRADGVVGGRGIRRLPARDRVRAARDRRRARARRRHAAGATSCGRSRCCRRCTCRGARASHRRAARRARHGRHVPARQTGTRRCLRSPGRSDSAVDEALVEDARRRPARRRARRRAR